MIEGLPHIRARKIRYFQEQVFKTRRHPPVAIAPITPVLRKLKSVSTPPARELSEQEKEMFRQQYAIDDHPQDAA